MENYNATEFPNDFQRDMVRQMHLLKDELLKKVVQQVLGRELFADSEVKDFQIVIHTEKPGREFIGYKGNLIGEIKMFHRIEDNKVVYGFEFEPKTTME